MPPPSAAISITRALAALVLRAGLGLTLILFHGFPEIRLAWEFVWEDAPWPLVDHVRALGIPLANFVTPAAVTIGLAAAVALTIGLLTRIAATILLAIMVAAAIGLVSPPASPLVELAFTYIVGFTALVCLGSGIFSLDALLSKTPRPVKKRPLA
ncbi:hypothetical protein BH23VER1_BH23VER1_33130 [soil metagenome]